MNSSYYEEFVSDALGLFQPVKDEKASAPVRNDLGNIYFAASNEDFVPSEKRNKDGAVSTTMEALGYLNRAVEISKRKFDLAANTSSKADCAQELADRLFNRSILYLSWIEGEEKEKLPQTIREMAYADLAFAKNLDNDVWNYRIEHRQLFQRSEDAFSRLTQRIRDLTKFSHDKRLCAVWDVRELVADADQLLSASWEHENAPLFHSMTRTGRLQQLNDVVATLEVQGGHHDETDRGYLSDPGKSLLVCMEVGEVWQKDPTFEELVMNLSHLYHHSCSSHDYFGVVASTLQGELFSEGLTVKKSHQSDHERMLKVIAEAESEMAHPVLPAAFDTLISSDAFRSGNDSYLLLVTDGFSWDTALCKQSKWQIHRLNNNPRRLATIHMIILGLDLDEAMKKECQDMVHGLTNNSFYADFSIENADDVFRSVSASISKSLQTF